MYIYYQIQKWDKELKKYVSTQKRLIEKEEDAKDTIRFLNKFQDFWGKYRYVKKIMSKSQSGRMMEKTKCVCCGKIISADNITGACHSCFALHKKRKINGTWFIPEERRKRNVNYMEMELR